MPKISVIVPVYCAETYLKKCIECILAQTFLDFELLLVDDGSPDNSGIICDSYASRDSRVRVIHKKNGGVSSARNEGLRQATGTYVMFCDSDDFVDSSWCIELYNNMNIKMWILESVDIAMLTQREKILIEHTFFQTKVCHFCRRSQSGAYITNVS